MVFRGMGIRSVAGIVMIESEGRVFIVRHIRVAGLRGPEQIDEMRVVLFGRAQSGVRHESEELLQMRGCLGILPHSGQRHGAVEVNGGLGLRPFRGAQLLDVGQRAFERGDRVDVSLSGNVIARLVDEYPRIGRCCEEWKRQEEHESRSSSHFWVLAGIVAALQRVYPLFGVGEGIRVTFPGLEARPE
jgi:hypothetical protein